MALMTKAGRILLTTLVAAVLAGGLLAGPARALEPGAPALGGPVPAAGVIQPTRAPASGEGADDEDGIDHVGLLGVAALLLFLYAGHSRRDRHHDRHHRSHHGRWRD